MGNARMSSEAYVVSARQVVVHRRCKGCWPHRSAHAACASVTGHVGAQAELLGVPGPARPRVEAQRAVAVPAPAR